jgi:hypothetical protein
MIPLKVAATSVKLAMPPPIRRALLRPSGSEVAHYNDQGILLQNMSNDIIVRKDAEREKA